MDVSKLVEIGLTNNEARVYLSLLKSGPILATQLVTNTGLHRTVTYDVLKRLDEKNLVRQVDLDGKKVFEAASPKQLRTMLRTKEKLLDSIMPQLTKISSFTPSINIRLLKGKQAMLTVLDEIIQDRPKEVLTFGAGGEEYDMIPAAIDQFHKKRIKNKIKIREIYRDNSSARQRGNATLLMPYAEVRYLPANIREPTHIDIYNNQIILFSTIPQGDAIITIIENKELASAFKEYFGLLWELSKPV